MKDNTALVTRNGLTWLLIAQALALFPLLFYLPWWTLVVWGSCAFWRIQIYRMKFNYPSRIVKVVLIVIIGVGIYVSRGTIIGLDGGLALLVAAFSLKLIELKTKRDALVIIYIGFLVITTLYLYDNSFAWTIYSLLPIVALVAALIGLNQTKLATRPLATVRLACILLLQAIPLMLVLFFFFPRLEPLWTLPIPKKQQTTGVSNSMTPGEVANMAKSSELVLRATFTDNQIPPRNKLYWRALTLELYNGRTWLQARDVRNVRGRYSPRWSYSKSGEHVTYNIIMQPSSQNWVIALNTPHSLPRDVVRALDFHLERDKPIESIYAYEMGSWLDAVREPDYTPRSGINKQLPRNQSDPRARAFGQSLRERYQGDTERIVEALLQRFHIDHYYYTLDTPDLGENSVDTFFFDTKRGFCEHYAGATTFILRAAGIPARVVLGYQGGEINTAGNFVQVRQFDAHAWVEYWEKDKGWVTIDPTFQVAPSRIEVGLNEALSTEEQEKLGHNALLGYGSNSFITSLRMTWENFNNDWDIFIAGYNSGQQLGMLKRLFGKANPMYLGMLLIIGGFTIVLIWMLFLFKPWKREKDPVLRCYQQFEKLLATQGITRELAEGPIDFARRAMLLLGDQREQIKAFNDAFIAHQYAEKGSASSLYSALKELKKVLSRKQVVNKKAIN